MISRQAAILASKGAKKQIASQYLCDEFQRIDKQLDIILAESEETTTSAIRIENIEAVSCDNPPRKIPYYRLNQSTLAIKR
jgi:hypothetical protein